MANEIISRGHSKILRANLLTNQAAITDGVWFEVSGFSQLSIHVSGITTATCQIRASNKNTVPATTDHGVQLGTDIVADRLDSITFPIRWVKVRVTAFTSGTINAWLEGVQP